jgi:DNA-binding MarR family transcriptional regulator
MPSKPDTVVNGLADIDRLIHEPARYNVMALLYVVKRAEYLFVQNQTGMTSGNLTAHTAKLEKAGYVAVEKKFVRKKPKTNLRLTSRGRAAFERYRQEMKRRLDTPAEIDTAQVDADPDS